MFVNNHTCTFLLLFETNCPYDCRNNCQMFAIRHVIFYFFQSIFSWGEITCVWVLNLCLNYQFLQQLTRSRTVYCITRCEKIIEHTGTRVNIIYIQYTYIVGKYKIYLCELQKQAEQKAFGELLRPVSQRVQIHFIFNDNVRILCLSCNVKIVRKLVRFRQKGQKQASFLAFHKCCQGCLLRGPRYIST